MNETNKQILELISKHTTLNEISLLTKLTPRQVWQRINFLKREGFKISEIYHYNGDIIFNLNGKNPLVTKQNEPIGLYSFKSDDTFKALVISDLHFGNIHEKPDLLPILYDYCINKGIHIILNCGDFLDGFLGRKEKIYTDGYEQMKYALKKYPFDSSILTFMVLGNHDVSILDRQGLDIINGIKSSRPDIIPLGYCKGEICVKNDSIALCHSIKGSSLANKIAYHTNSTIVLFGHSHKMKIDEVKPGQIYINSPSTSSLFFSEDEIYPGALVIEAAFSKGFFSSINIKHLLIDGQIHKVSETQIELRSSDEIKELYKRAGKIAFESKKIVTKILKK